MVEVEKRKDESIDKVLKKFKTRMRREGILDEIRKREYYEKPSQVRRKSLEKAKRREVRRKQDEE